MKKIKLIQLGGQLNLNDLYQLNKNNIFEFYFVKENEIHRSLIKGKPLFNEHNNMNSIYDNAIFILDRSSAFLNNNFILQQLPASRTIFETNSYIDQDFFKVFHLRNFSFFDFNNSLEKKLSDLFYVKNVGSKLGMDSVYFTNEFDGNITLNGNDSIFFNGNARLDAVKVMGWPLNFFYGKNSNLEFYPECEVYTDNTKVVFNIKVFSKNSNSLNNTVSLVKTRDNTISPSLIHIEEESYIYVSVYIKGHGEVQFSIGQCHILPYRYGKGDLSFGGESIVDRNNLNGRILFNFDAGDMKPPLNVYFGGFNRGDFFEGYRMLKKMGSPFILVSDTRLIGGAFYIGSEKFENELINFIRTKMKLLHFSEKQLILAGLSMGTFGALYYAASLNPKAVVIGKPLVNIGDIALNEKVKRPGVFPESLDLLLMKNCGFMVNDPKSLNNKFWQKFKTNKFKDTIFVIAYMKQDDYDSQAFVQISNYLKTNQPDVKILHKGLIGRHNDNTSGIVEYFAKQWNSLLKDLYKS